MNFKESLDYLFGLGYERSVQKFGLENSIILLNALGNPQNKFVKIQVAGTNGKGSTCAFLESICGKAGIKVGVNTSPHLVSVTERVRINGADISESEFAKYVSFVRTVSEQLVKTHELAALPTFFEHITAIAQLAFAESGVEIAILEAGLGGRFDATTATRAEVVAITPISLDHTKTLGDTISKIAAEKAAIIRPGVEAVIADQPKEAMVVIEEKCRISQVIPWHTSIVDTEISEPDTPNNLAANEFLGHANSAVSFRSPNRFYGNVRLGLLGNHQIENAKTAILLAEVIKARGYLISGSALEDGLENAVHKGRLEYSHGILFDGAHNVAGAKALREFLVGAVDKPITMIFGSMSGKDLSEISKILFPIAKHLILTTPKNPRAMEAGEIRNFVPKTFGNENIWVLDGVGAAISTARELCDHGLIVVTGSLYLIGEVKANLITIEGENLPSKS